MATTLAVGSVAAVQRVRHPIRLARKVMESEHVLLVGAGAEQFARAHGVEQCPPASLVVPRELERWNAIRDSSGFQVREAFVGAWRTPLIVLALCSQRWGYCGRGGVG